MARRLAVLHEACGQAPCTGARIEAAPHEQHLATPMQDHAGGGHGIAVVDESARGTGGAHRPVIVLRDETGAAQRAEAGVTMVGHRVPRDYEAMQDVRKTHAEVRVVSHTRTSSLTALEG